tara:strand:- start:1886 stop:3430 length:1545 start_codon:yes stop_codon:yes gene_type:complete
MSKATRQSHGIDGLMTMTISGTINSPTPAAPQKGPWFSLKQNHNDLLARGTEAYILSYRENTLAALPTTGKTGAAKWVIPQMWEREWNPRLGVSITPLDFNSESDGTKLVPELWLKPENILLTTDGTKVTSWEDSSATPQNWDAATNDEPPISTVENANRFAGPSGNGVNNSGTYLNALTDMFDLPPASGGTPQSGFLMYFVVKFDSPNNVTANQTLFACGSNVATTEWRIFANNFDGFGRGDVVIEAKGTVEYTASNAIAANGNDPTIIGVARTTDGTFVCRVNGANKTFTHTSGSAFPDVGNFGTSSSLISTLNTISPTESNVLKGTLLEAFYVREKNTAALQATNISEFSGEATAGGTITIISSDGTEITYAAYASGGGAANGQLDPKGRVKFLTDANTTTQAANLVAAINDTTNGHGAKITASNGGSNLVILQQASLGAAGNTPITITGLPTLNFNASYKSRFQNGAAGINVLDMEKIESYLGHKFGIALPDAHPYSKKYKRKSAIEAVV